MNKEYSNEDFTKFVKSELNYEVKNGVYQYQKDMSLTPYILEERKMNVTTMDVFSRLMADRILFAWGPVNGQMCSYLLAQLLYLNQTDKDADIQMYINSPGGGVTDGTAVTDTMQLIDADVATVNIGMAASMGSVFLAAGTKGKRASYISAKAMIHQASYGAQGHTNDIAINVIEGERANYLLLKRLARHTDCSFDELVQFAERDLWLDSKQQEKFGIIDKVISNSKKPIPTIEDDMDGFEEYLIAKQSKIIKTPTLFTKNK